MHKIRHGLSLAAWHTQHLQVAPLLQAWLTHRASLTARLQAHSQQFRVQKLSQRVACCLRDEYAELGLARAGKTMQREVLLRCDGEAVVYGHTVVPLSATAQEWPLFRHLGERSLGTTLFNDPLVERGTLHYAWLTPAHPLFARIAVHCPQVRSCTRLPARRSVFKRRGGVMLVTEVFLPTVLNLRVRVAHQDKIGLEAS